MREHPGFSPSGMGPLAITASLRRWMGLLFCLLLPLFTHAEEDAMRPFRGTWTTDPAATVGATRKEFPKATEEFLKSAMQDLVDNPVTLTITEREFSSISLIETINDIYRVLEVVNGAVTIRLKTKGEVVPDEGRERRCTLRIKEGNLLLKPSGTDLIVVFKRAGGIVP
jgi:hypothetical protein